MKTVEKRDYMQSALDVSTRTYYKTEERARKVAQEEFLKKSKIEDLLSFGASVIKESGVNYYRIEFSAHEFSDWDNMAHGGDDPDITKEFWDNKNALSAIEEWASEEYAEPLLDY